MHSAGQVYPVCLKLELDVERACGLDTALQLGGWALRTAIEKNRRKKMLQNVSFARHSYQFYVICNAIISAAIFNEPTRPDAQRAPLTIRGG